MSRASAVNLHDLTPDTRMLTNLSTTSSTARGALQCNAGGPRRHPGARQFALVPMLAALSLAFGAGAVSAADFTISDASTTARTLTAGSAGNVTAAGSLTVSGATIAVTVTGNNATLTNLGTIKQTGTGKLFRDNTGVTGLVINNGNATNSTALMQAAADDVIQMNKASASVTLNNYGQMISLNAPGGGAQAVDFTAITSGANTVNNYAGGLMSASEADAVRPGVNGGVYNWGTILSVTGTGSSSDGVDLQKNSGGQITNYGTGLIQGGRHGITGGALDASTSFSAAISNLSGGIIQGDNGSGINLDGFNNKQLVTIVNGGLIVGRGVTVDGDGIDVDGLVNIANTGTIRSLNAFNLPGTGLAFSEGITVGGGTITNSGLIEGLVTTGNSNAVGRGISLSGNDITVGPLAGTREAIYGNAVVTNNFGGVIRGQTDSAIVAEGARSGFTVTITNNAGATIVGGSASFAAIRTGKDSAIITNRGLIDGSSSGKAIDMGSGDNTLNIVGGQARVLGDISGGIGGYNVMTISPGAGNRFSYGGALSNFASIEIQGGSVTLSGVSNYDGITTITGGAVLVLDGANRLSASSALVLNGGTLALAHAGGANGQTFASLALGADSVIDLGGSSLTFNSLGGIAGAAKLGIVDYLASASPVYAIRLKGDYSADASFQSLLAGLKIDGLAATYHFDGIYTDVTAVPEPANAAMLLAGLGLLLVIARRRQPGARS
jgi:hypothetical protein